MTTPIAERNTPTETEELNELPRELIVSDDALSPAVAWLAKMPTTIPETAVIQVTSLLSAVMLRRTCFERYQEAVIPAQGVGQASIIVDAKKLEAALKTVTGRLVITIDDGTLSIADGERTARLKTADEAVEFPRWPQFEGRGKAAINSREMVQVLTAVGVDESLPQLMTVAFDEGTMVATDRFRLSAISYSQDGFTGTVPASVLRPFAKVDTAVFVEAGTSVGDPDDWVELRSGMRTVTAPMPEAEFPKWRGLIPEDPPLRVLLPKEALYGAVSGDEVSFTIAGEVMRVTSASDGIETEQQIKLFQTVRNELDGPLKVHIRSKYVKDALRALNSGLVMFEATSADKPVMFRDISEKDLHLVMPVRQSA